MPLRKIILFLLIFYLFSFNVVNSEKKSFVEKIYTQTDKPLYFPGETIWFKSYITNAENKISTISEVMSAELFSPKGTIIKDIKLSVKHGYAYGDFQIEDDWVGGVYKIRMYTQWMKNFGKESFFEKEIIVQKVLSPKLLMKLDFDKEAYGSGSTVVANFEVKSLKNIPLSNEKIQFEVQVKGQKILTKSLNTNSKGQQRLTFELPNNLKTADVLLNVLIPYKNFAESISRSVPVTLNNIDLQFFPESGKAIIGTKNIIAFKALNEFGKPADISGEIFNSKGQFITNFKSYHNGMGAFNLTPESKNYYAQITEPFKSDSLIPLPPIHSSGVTLSVKSKSNKYLVRVFSTKNDFLTLTLSDTYKNLVTKYIEINEHKAEFEFSKNKFPDGIIKISLSDSLGHIVAERLLFINSSNKLNIAVSLDKESYETREKVKLKIKTTDKFNKPIPSNLSVSIVDNKLISFADDKQDNICSYLLMSSELKGKIHKPSFYFDPLEPKAGLALDYIMLTHGWRTYFSEYIEPSTASFKPELKDIQYGTVVDKNNRPAKSHLLLFDQNSNKVLKFDTNDKGEFSFKVNRLNNLLLLAYADDEKKLKIRIGKLAQSSVQKNNQIIKNNINSLKINQLDTNKPLKEPIKVEVIVSNNLSLKLDEDGSSLDEVVIVGYGVQSRKSLSGSVVTVIDNNTISKLDIDNIGRLLQGRVTGIQTVNESGISGSNSVISVRGSRSIMGNSQPTFVIDGVLMDQNNTNSTFLNYLEPSNIDRIHILKGAAACAIYGYSGANGVIVISTKNQKYNRFYNSKSLNNKKFHNYAVKTFYTSSRLKTYHSKQFYIPVYESKNVDTKRNDFRQTIYWNPVIQTDQNGEASFEYYNSDAITSFVITTEGVGYQGLVGRNETKYFTKKFLNIDLKTPNYMAINDTINLPITITNESNGLISSRLTFKIPNELKLISPLKNSLVNIEPNSHQTRTITVVPTSKAQKTTIRASVVSDEYSDKIEKNITIISPYFPTQVSISGIKDNSYTFNMKNVVPGSLKSEFSIYTDIVGDVMDGVESLIRQPSGCFEQVSSSTYPNILILKYLKETNKSNPAIEKKAMNYIKRGYKKLTAYETSKNGFEWYGHAPPHEALSAYGLLEFIEMKDVYHGVSEPMIQRTINFLMSRRNGKGGFKQHRGKYGFSAAPKNVNNAYIVYAISESKLKVAIENEYNFTFAEALKSNDFYRMALMACASINFDKAENAQLLIGKIREGIQKYGFEKIPVEHTITRSYGDSKQIETAAFVVLALIKQGGLDIEVSKGIEYLLSKRKYGRFGSTQSTSMALKALIAYTKTQKQKEKFMEGEFVDIQINDKHLKVELIKNDHGKIVISHLEKYLKSEQQSVTVRFSNPKVNFPYLLNLKWDSRIPNSSSQCKLELKTDLSPTLINVGETVRINVQVKNKTNKPLPMTTVVLGIPSGTSVQPWQLKQVLEQDKADYFEIFDNYLVFYWKEFNSSELKEIRLDLKAEIPGIFQAAASSVYLYYADEFKHWEKGNKVIIN